MSAHGGGAGGGPGGASGPRGEGSHAPGAGPGEMSEEELRAAYEAELERVTSADVMMQAAVSLLNLAARRLAPPAAPPGGGEPQGATRDLEQVREAIDGVRALMGVLERRFATELGPLRDALSQLQLAYAREAQAAGGEATQTGAAGAAPGAAGAPAGAAAAGAGAAEQGRAPGGEGAKESERPADQPGPAEASGRLWVPGR